jgi:single-strand DNA-binding protein
MADSQVAEKETAAKTRGVRVLPVNESRIAGRLGRDPDVKTVGDQLVANLSIAVNRRVKVSEGKYEDKADFVGVTAWGKNAEFARDHLKKGTAVDVSGPLRTNKWEGKAGEKHQTVYIEARKIDLVTKQAEKGAGLEK